MHHERSSYCHSPELRSCVNREVGLGSYSLSHSSPVPDKVYGFYGRKASGRQEEVAIGSRHSFFDVRHELRKWRAHIAGQRTRAWAEIVGDCVFCIQFLESPLTKLSWKIFRKYSSTCDVSTYFPYIQPRATFQFDKGFLSASVTDTIQGHHFFGGDSKIWVMRNLPRVKFYGIVVLSDWRE